LTPDVARYQICTAERVTATIVEAWLRPLAEQIDFQSGQYVLMEDADRQIPPRSYSPANAPRPDGQISLLVTRVPGGSTSSWVHDQLRIGDEVILTGPYGDFGGRQSTGASRLYLAAGSGMAPIRALVETSLKTAPDRLQTVVFSARTSADVLSQDLFLDWQAAHCQLRFVPVLTGEDQMMRVPDRLPEICPDLADHEVFIAGPPGFILASASAAEALGAAWECIHSEPFFAELRA
jgi:CDP-4-dehydro-6-deoxyglucose reductase, E3